MHSTVRTKYAAFAVLASITLQMQAGWADAAAAPAGRIGKPEQQSTRVAAVHSNLSVRFETLLKDPARLPEAIAFLNQNVGKVSVNEATVMVLHLENALRANQTTVERRFAEPSVQEAISKVYKQGDTFTSLAYRSKDPALKALLLRTALSGYKLETAEGFLFPVLNYSAFARYNKRVAADIRTYIDLMRAESSKAPVKDGRLMIGYQELVNRSLAQEGFLVNYPWSNRAKRVMNLFHSYKVMTFYGVNNTPLFKYEDQYMSPNAKKGYILLLEAHQPDIKSSAYLQLLNQFVALAEKQDYKLTREIESFRRQHVPLS